jgi:murein L,D-transpeptidase YcbB/YkuD
MYSNLTAMKTMAHLKNPKIATLILLALISFTTRVTALSNQIADTTLSGEIRLQLDSFKNPGVLYFPKSVTRFYKRHDYQPVWINHQQKAWQGALLLNCVLQFGLNHSDYHPKELNYSSLHQVMEHPQQLSRKERAKCDIMITDALITFMNHLHFGKLNPFYSSVQIDDCNTGEFCAPDLLADAASAQDMLSPIVNVQPRAEAYTDLQNKMRDITQYQEDCDEIPGVEVRKMAINMERLRWAEITGNNWVQVNIPSFTLEYHLSDTTILFKTVVGPAYKQTPVLNSYLTDFTTAPKLKIIKLPGDIPGSKNPRGVIYFWFKNQHGISLAGRPEKDLFDKHERAFSSDEILVEQPEKLARLILENDNNKAGIKALRESIANYAVKNFILQKPVPLKITYITCEVRSGVVINYPDLYNKDKQLEMALYNTNQLPDNKLVGYVKFK